MPSLFLGMMDVCGGWVLCTPGDRRDSTGLPQECVSRCQVLAALLLTLPLTDGLISIAALRSGLHE